MKKTTIIWLAVGVVVLFVVLSVIGFYNKMVTLNQNVDNQWAQVENQYKRRLDLIPNLVNSVQGVMAQEKTIFGDLADARTKYGSASTSSDKAAAATEVESAFSRLLVVMENYPTLKSSENVTNLMAELSGTENRVTVERGRFNDTVKEYNTAVKRFPANLMAGMFGYNAKSYFDAPAGSENAPPVNLTQ